MTIIEFPHEIFLELEEGMFERWDEASWRILASKFPEMVFHSFQLSTTNRYLQPEIIMEEKRYTLSGYISFMEKLNNYITMAEAMLVDLPKFKEAAKLSYSEWVASNTLQDENNRPHL